MMTRSKITPLKKNFLALLLCALLLPPFAVLLAAALAHLGQEEAMKAAVKSYVLNLAESVAYRLGSEVPNIDFNDYNFSIAASGYGIFALGPSIPGWVAYVDYNGNIMMSSPGAGVIRELWNKNIPVGKAICTWDADGRQYTIAAYPIQNGGYVVAAVSWSGLLGNLARAGTLWPLLIAGFTLCSFFAIRQLWRRLISPLKSLAFEIDGFSEGKRRLGEPDGRAVWEIESLHGALTRFAKAAVERDNLRNRYVRDIVRAQENERMEMAREIHDGPLQDITALLQQIHMIAEENGSGQERVKKTELLARVAVRELRGMCDELAPPWVDLGLAQALNEVADRLSMNYDLRVSVDIESSDTEGSFELEKEQTMSLVRIFQEAVSNAARHGKATEVHASARLEGGKVIFEIQDNGEGFDARADHQTLRLEGHRGLANMTERMSLIGGTFEVRSAKDKGTVIICSLNAAPPSRADML